MITSAIQIFGSRLKLLAGSLKDVKEIKGQSVSDEPEQFINENGFRFLDFSESVESWFDAFENIELAIKSAK